MSLGNIRFRGGGWGRGEEEQTGGRLEVEVDADSTFGVRVSEFGFLVSGFRFTFSVFGLGF